MIERSSTKWLLLMTGGLMCAAVAIAAQAQTVASSPFAKKSTKKQAWETQTPAPSPQAPSAPTLVQPNYAPQSAQKMSGEDLPPLPSGYSYAPAQAYDTPSYGAPSDAAQSRGSVYNPETSTAPALRRAPVLQYQSRPQYQTETLSGRPAQPYYPGRVQTGQNTYPNPYAGNAPMPQGQEQGVTMARKRSWMDRMGLTNLKPTISGFLNIGAAGTQRKGDLDEDGNWSEDFIFNGQIRAEASGITQGGLEYGAGVKIRGEYDKYRRSFGGRVGDCPPSLAGCAGVLVAGTPTAIRGHTSGFYTAGPSNANKEDLAAEGLYVFLRSSYGDVMAGRDDGAAYLFSLGAPTLLSVGASNNSVDYTGLDAVKTRNDASGFAEKVTYVSPRLLGDTVGVGVQIGASYSPDSKACGTDYCVKANGKDGTGVLSPDLKDVIEMGVSLDRNFGNGLKAEATATYAMASEQSGLTGFDDLKSWGAGLELGYKSLTLGGSYLKSNNGLIDGDYTAWDIGATWQPSALGFTAGYGQAKDKSIDLTSDQAVFGISYDINERYRLGTGVQYIERTTPYNVGGVITPTVEQATSIFIEGRITF